MKLRYYQQDAVDTAIKHIKKSVMPALLELSGGAGKSLIVSAIAHWFNKASGKKVLCIQPTKELCEGNAKKYLATGERMSVFSASAGSKCMRHSVVFGTPATIANSISRFGDAFGLVIVDEAHRTTKQIKEIIEEIRKKNPRLRVLGLTGTPYRHNDGYIYQYRPDGSFVTEDEARNPYYNNLLYRITTQELIDMGYLTQMHGDPDTANGYDTSSLKLKSNGKFDQAEIERVFEGKGRLTYNIVCDIVRHSVGHKSVMIFAATVPHMKEILESLPPDNSRGIGGDLNMGATREAVVKDFEQQKFKYLVSVGTMTTGVDFPAVSIIAVMRATESASLFQQIIWRGVRLINNSVAGDHAAIAASEKPESILLDYAENVDRFELHDDLFRPTIRVKGSGIKGEGMIVTCPSCGFGNEFSGRLNPDNYDYSPDGYFLDPLGNPVETEHGPMPSHHGRRCTGQVKSGTDLGVYVRCEHRWTSKECLECGHANDIAARYCEACKAEIIDPNEKLQMEFARIKKDPYTPSTDRVLNWTANRTVTSSGNDALLCEYTTEYRTFSIWYNPSAKHPQAQLEWKSLNEAVFSGHVAPNIDMFLQYLSKGKPPTTVTAHRERGSKFYRIIAHNRPEDRLP
jgi:DNA repair protein RadD